MWLQFEFDNHYLFSIVKYCYTVQTNKEYSVQVYLLAKETVLL